MKIAIVGAGNIGTAMAALFASSGEAVTLVARGHRLEVAAQSVQQLYSEAKIQRGVAVAAQTLSNELFIRLQALQQSIPGADAQQKAAVSSQEEEVEPPWGYLNENPKSEWGYLANQHLEWHAKPRKRR